MITRPMITRPMITRRGRLVAEAPRACPAGLRPARARRRPATAARTATVLTATVLTATVLTATVLAALVLTGCATIPASGTVQNADVGQSGVSQAQNYPQLIPVGPGPGWTPTQIVQGFLAASASFADDHAVARQYLDSATGRSWRPGWAVTVVSANFTVNIVQLPRPISLQPGSGLVNVEVTGLPVATLTGAGQYQVSSGQPARYKFSLIKINGQWRIDNLPRGTPLLLTQADFQQVYQSRDLYFLAPSGRTLVPEPVFVPQQATNTGLATGLVNALLQGPAGWLSGAAATGFPAHSRQIGQVKIIGPNAIVNLGQNAAAASRQRREQMAAQLAWTLASAPGSIHSVELEIDGRPQQLLGSAFQLPQTYHGWVPAQADGSSLDFIGAAGSVDQLSSANQPASGRVSPAGTPHMPALSAIAVSPDGASVAGISADDQTVYVSSVGQNSAPRVWRCVSGPCTSLSWDAQGDLWIASAGDLWMLPPGAISASPVQPPNSEPDANVLDFQVAPDGVRAVMIVTGASGGKPGAQIQLAAITRSNGSVSIGPSVPLGEGITEPGAVSWFGADDVIALSGTSSAAQLDEVPLDGGTPQAIPAPANAVSVTAASQGTSSSSIAVGLSGGQIMVSQDLGVFQATHASGSSPAYPAG
jgi:Lipoprotein LpqB beta-propeller domain/Sporulation and spore germination